MRKFKKRMDRITDVEALARGVDEHVGAHDLVVLDGERHTRADLEALLAEQAAVERRVDAARVAWVAALAEQRAFAERKGKLVALLRKWIHVSFGSRPEVLVAFGLEPHKPPRELTVEEKQAIGEKIRATRAARHTMGRRQRLAIKAPTTPAPEPSDSASEE